MWVMKNSILRAISPFGPDALHVSVPKNVGFYAVMAVITAIITWFLSRDKKRIRFLSAVLVGATWPMSFPVALMFSLF